MKDAEFLDTLAREFNAITDAVQHSNMFLYDTSIPTAQRTGFWPHVFSESFEFFVGFAQASSDAAERLVATLDTTLVKALGEEANNETSTTVEDIRDDLSQWQDSAAADRFRDGYLNHLENALEYQLQFAVALRGLMDLQWGLIRATREAVIEICKQTAARIKEAQVEADRREREMLGSLLSTAFAIVAGAATGGVAEGLLGAVVGALGGFGGAVSKVVEPNTGTTPTEIYTQMHDAVLTLAGNVGHEQDEFRKGLQVLQQWTTGNLREEMLPPELQPSTV